MGAVVGEAVGDAVRNHPSGGVTRKRRNALPRVSLFAESGSPCVLAAILVVSCAVGANVVETVSWLIARCVFLFASPL